MIVDSMIGIGAEWKTQTVPRRSTRAAAQRAADMVVILDLESGRYFGLEGAADLIWELCDGQHNVGDIIGAVSTEFHVDPEVVRTDAVEFLEHLRIENLVERAA